MLKCQKMRKGTQANLGLKHAQNNKFGFCYNIHCFSLMRREGGGGGRRGEERRNELD